MKRKIVIAALIFTLGAAACGPAAGGTESQGGSQAAGTEQMSPEKTGSTEDLPQQEEQKFELSEEGKEFLAFAGVRIPDFDETTNFDDKFWGDFLFAYYTGSAGVEADGEIVATDPIKISREEAKETVRLIFGKDLPDYEPSRDEMNEGQTVFYYEDGYYYIGASDYPDFQYSYKTCETGEDGVIRAVYGITFEGDDNAGTLTYELSPADNAHGFIILAKKTDFSGGILAPEEGTIGALTEWLTRVNAECEPDTAGSSLVAARFGGELLDWYAVADCTDEMIKEEVQNFYQSKNDEGKELFTEQVELIGDMVEEVAGEKGAEVLESAGYTAKENWDTEKTAQILEILKDAEKV